MAKSCLINCLVCKKEFKVWPYRIKSGKYCSSSCFHKSTKGKPTWNKTNLKTNCFNCNKQIKTTPYKIKNGFGKYCSKLCKSNFEIGKIPWNKNLKGFKSWNKGLRAKDDPRIASGKRHGMWHKINSSLVGEKNPNWNGGVTSTNELLRKTFEYEDWRKSVFERDNYTCQICKQIGGILQADHIKPFAYFEELRFELSNGRTLCINCHRQTDTFGGRVKKYQEVGI